MITEIEIAIPPFNFGMPLFRIQNDRQIATESQKKIQFLPS